MEIKQYDTVKLKNGMKATIVEVLSKDVFIADIGDSIKNWETIDITLDDIQERFGVAEGMTDHS